MSNCANRQISLPAQLCIGMCLFIDTYVHFYMYADRYINKTWLVFWGGEGKTTLIFELFLACKYIELAKYLFSLCR